MAKIKILDENVANIIAAGEVVENPAAMIKELVENSLDANATSVIVTVDDNGRYVKIKDNGDGMEKDDILMSIERHATSKISKKEDIYNLVTYGFRGEALASIAAVSKMTMASKTENMQTACKMNVFGGIVRGLSEEAMNRGTEIEIKDLFYNMPARLKFLKSKNTEYSKIREIILREALVNFNVAFTLILDGKEQIKTSGKGFENTVLELFGKNVLRSLVKFENGYAGDLTLNKSSRDYLFTFFNGRFAKAAVVDKAIIDAYYTKLMKDRYPFVILFLNVPPNEIDVNIHPSKKIVKFTDEKKIYETVKLSIMKIFETEEKAISSPFITPVSQMEVSDLGEQGRIFEKEALYETKVQKNDNFNNKNTEEETVAPFFLFTPKTDEVKETSKYIYENNRQEKNDTPEKIYISEEKIEKISIEENIRKIHNYKIIGQLFNMYILVENDSRFEIYDQHIVHERILYEELKERIYNKNIVKKLMLIPIKIELDRMEKDIVLKNIENLSSFGFDVEEFGERDILIRAVPDIDFKNGIKDLFSELIADLKNEINGIKDIREKIVISMSCKGAVKAGEKLDIKEMELLILKLHEIGKYTCPHGRPIIVQMDFEELEKRFKRKL